MLTVLWERGLWIRLRQKWKLGLLEADIRLLRPSWCYLRRRCSWRFFRLIGPAVDLSIGVFRILDSWFLRLYSWCFDSLFRYSVLFKVEDSTIYKWQNTIPFYDFLTRSFILILVFYYCFYLINGIVSNNRE